MAFSTASSNATLPTSLRVADTELKLPRKVARFVLTIGAPAKQNGTAMFEGVTVLFLAQFFGVELPLAHPFMVMLVCFLGRIGTAGVPAGSSPARSQAHTSALQSLIRIPYAVLRLYKKLPSHRRPHGTH